MPKAVKEKVYNVLFVCTGNSARSIMAEAILNRAGQGNFRAFSAGSQPKGSVHPYTLDLLRKLHYDVSKVHSKSWLEFSQAGAPPLDFVFTVCDNAASEVCPVWPGQPMTAHWGVSDPAAATGNEAEVRFAFADTLRMLTNRINILTTVFVRKYNHAGVYSIASLIFGIVRELGLRCIPSISRQFVVAAKLDVLKKHAFCKVI